MIAVAVDFTGTGRQARGPLNAVPSSTLAGVYYVVKAITIRRSRTTAAATGPSTSTCRKARWSTRAGRLRSLRGRRR